VLRGRIRFSGIDLPERASTVDSKPAPFLPDDPWGAGEGIRTLDNQLGRLELYQLSYTRIVLDLFVKISVPLSGALPVDSNRCFRSAGFDRGRQMVMVEGGGFEPP
jgi:hypothetical protein